MTTYLVETTIGANRSETGSMPCRHVIRTDLALEKIAEHGVTEEEVAHVPLPPKKRQ